MSSPSRSELIQNAILFLNDPKVHSSTLTSKIEFLQSKGLNEDEIQEAIRSAGNGNGHMNNGQPSNRSSPNMTNGMYAGSSYGPSYNNGYGRMDMEMAPIPPKRDWRDLFIMAVISGGVVYGLSTLARKYLLPHLQPPSSTAFQSTSTEITAQYDEAANLLRELKEQTGELQKSVDEDRERVNAVVAEVEEAVKAVRSGEDTWRGELREIRGEVESVRELVPRMIEKHSASQTSALADLQSELKSLKTLLVSRQHLVSNQPQSSTTQQSSTTTSPGASTIGYSIPRSSSANGMTNGSVTPTTAAANALLSGTGGKKGIPAWQLAPSSSTSSSGEESKETLDGEKEKEST